jgi:hypothetical protein
VAQELAKKGYDPRYGARPLKRAIERELLAPLADQMNRYAAETALEIDVGLPAEPGKPLVIHVRARLDNGGRTVCALIGGAGLAEAAQRITQLRRNCQEVEQSPPVLELRNEIVRLQKLKKQLDHRVKQSLPSGQEGAESRGKTWVRLEDVQRLSRLPELCKLSEELTAQLAQAAALEDKVLLSVYGKADSTLARVSAELQTLVRRRDELALALYCRRFPKPDTVTLAIYSEDPEVLVELTRAYVQVARAMGGRVEAYQYRPTRADAALEASSGRQVLDPEKHRWVDGQRGLTPTLERRPIPELDPFLAAPQPRGIGLGLSIGAPAAYPRFAPEQGLHLLANAKKTSRCLICTSEVVLAEYVPPEGIERRGAIGGSERQRSYDFEEGVVEDILLGRKFAWPSRHLLSVLTLVLEERLAHHVRESLKR